MKVENARTRVLCKESDAIVIDSDSDSGAAPETMDNIKREKAATDTVKGEFGGRVKIENVPQVVEETPKYKVQFNDVLHNYILLSDCN